MCADSTARTRLCIVKFISMCDGDKKGKGGGEVSGNASRYDVSHVSC